MEIGRHWNRWGWLVALIAISIVVLRLAWGREAFCGPASEHCLREWVSAVGGWLAIIVALPTLYYLAKQISDANQHHLDFMNQEKAAR